MDNVLASRLGRIALDAGNPGRKGIGDSIDRGLVLCRLLKEKGFILVSMNPNFCPIPEMFGGAGEWLSRAPFSPDKAQGGS